MKYAIAVLFLIACILFVALLARVNPQRHVQVSTGEVHIIVPPRLPERSAVFRTLTERPAWQGGA